MFEHPTPRADFGLSVCLIVICCGVLWETRKIPPGSFEPLGSAPIPQAVAVLIIVLCLAIMAHAIYRWARGADGGSEEGSFEEDSFRPRPWAASLVFGFTLLYVAAMAFSLTSFAIATSLFLFVSISFLTGFERRTLPLAGLVAVGVGFGCQYLFTQVFVVDLPTH